MFARLESRADFYSVRQMSKGEFNWEYFGKIAGGSHVGFFKKDYLGKRICQVLIYIYVSLCVCKLDVIILLFRGTVSYRTSFCVRLFLYCLFLLYDRVELVLFSRIF